MPSTRSNLPLLTPLAASLPTQIADMFSQPGGNQDEMKQFIDMVFQEMQYVIAVLRGATDRNIDLTRALHHAIDVVPDIIYRTLKYQLSQGWAK